MTPQQFTLDLAMKSAGPSTDNGESGLTIRGYATRFGELDAEGEWVDPQAFAQAAQTFFDGSSTNGPVPILFHHGFDPELGAKRIGRITDWKVDGTGLLIEAFLPEPPANLTDAIGAKARAVWESVKAGLINGLSIGGVMRKLGTQIKSVALYEVSVTPTPCLASATFGVDGKALLGVMALASKSMPAVDDAVSAGMVAPTEIVLSPASITGIAGAEEFIAGVQSFMTGVAAMKAKKDAPKKPTTQYGLSRKGHQKALDVAMKEGSILLHSHLLEHGNYSLETQGDHSPSSCPVCMDMRAMYGSKADGITPNDPPASAAAAAASVGTGDQTGGASGQLTHVAVKTPLSPADLLGRMAELTGYATILSQLHATLTLPEASDTEGALVGPSGLDAKAGRTISGLNIKSLRAFATAVVDCGQQLHAWLDDNTPDPADEPAVASAPAAAPAPAGAAATPAKAPAAAAATSKPAKS